MKKTSILICARILLIVAICSFCGLTATASALVHQQGSIGCCDHGPGGDEPAETAPCPVADCPCASCMTATFPGSAAAVDRAISFCSFPLPAQESFRLSGFTRSIDYPPEN